VTRAARAAAIALAALLLAALASGCGGQSHALPAQAGLPAIGDDPAAAPVGAAAGVNVFGLSRRQMRFVMITHGQASDPFWAVVQRGAQDAGRQLGVSVAYEAPDTYDVARMAALIRAAAATKPAGLVVSLPDALSLGPAVRAAERQGIPVISINSGSDEARSLGTLLHVGQGEYQAGLEAGTRMAAAHVHRALCVIHESGNAALQERCHGFRDALAAHGATSGVVYVDLQNKAQAGRTIAAVVRGAHYDGLLTLGGASIAAPTLDALRRNHLLGKVTYATFGIGPEVLKAVRDGEMQFAVDQQPYLQGYLPIVLLTQYRLYGVLPDRGKLLATGPAFITKQNAARVVRLAERGVR